MIVAHTSPVEHTVIVALGLGAVLLYGWAWVRASEPANWRLASWCGGVAVLMLSILPAMETWAQRSFTGHMVQHLLMIVVAAPLLVGHNQPTPTAANRLPGTRSKTPSDQEKRDPDCVGGGT